MPRGTGPLDAATIANRLWTPDTVAAADCNLEAWWDLSDASTVGTSAGAVTSVVNKAGNPNYTLLQATPSLRPLYSLPTAGVTGASMAFDGTDDFMATTTFTPFAAPTLLAGGSVCAVVLCRGVGSTSRHVINEASTTDVNSTVGFGTSSITGSLAVGFMRNLAGTIFINNTQSLGISPWTTTPTNIVSWVYDQSFCTGYMNGAIGTPAAVSAAYSGTIATTRWSVGAYARATPTGIMNCRVHEVLLFSSTSAFFPDRVRQKAEGYVRWKWPAVAPALNASHLYVNRPPEIGA